MEKKKKSVKFINSISTNIIVVVAVIIIASLLVLTAIAKNFAENRLTSTEEESLVNVAEEKAIALEQYVADQKVIAQMIQGNATIVEQALTYESTGTYEAYVQNVVAETLASIYENTGEIYENLFVTFGSMGYADCLGNTTLHDVSDEAFYTECLNNGYYFGNNVSPVTGRPVYVIAYAIYNPTTGAMIGTVNMSIDMASMGADIVNAGQYDVTVLDLTGIVIATNGSEDNILTDIGSQDPEGFSAMLAAGTGTKVMDLSQYGLGVTYLAFNVTENFIVETSLDETEITTPIKEMSKNLTFVSLFMVILSVVVILIVISAMIKPIKLVTKDVESMATEIKGGSVDLTKNITTKSKNEIGVLVRSVNELVHTMGSIISTVQGTTGKVADSSSEINRKIDDAKTEVTSVSATMEEMSASSEETSASLSQVMEQVDSVAEQVDGVNNESQTQAEYAAEVVKNVNDIR